MHANIANILCLVPEGCYLTYLFLGIVDGVLEHDLKPVLTIMPESPAGEFVPPDSLKTYSRMPARLSMFDY